MTNRTSSIAGGLLFLAFGLIVAFIFFLPPTSTRTMPAVASPTPVPVSAEQHYALEGDIQLYGTNNFLIHYVTEGDNAVPLTDTNRSDVPDYVEKIGTLLEFSLAQETTRLGFAPPPSDRGVGGDDRFDVYLFYIDYFGYVAASKYIGDNPNTAPGEERAAYSYMALDTTFNAYRVYGLTPEQAIGITMGHEYNHAIQNGYDANDELWLMESSAALIENLLHPSIHDNIGYLIAHSEQPDTCLPVTTPFYHAYSHWYFLKYLTEQHPLGEKLPARIWDMARAYDGLYAVNAALDGQLDTYWGKWVIANLAHQACPAGAPYCMDEGWRYPPVAIEGRMTPYLFRSSNGSVLYTPPDGVGGYGVDYIDLTPFIALQTEFDLTFIGKTPNVNYVARLVGFGNSATPEITEVPLTDLAGTLRFKPTDYKRLYLTVENHTLALEAQCGNVYGDYVVGISRPNERVYYDNSRLTLPVHAAPTFDVNLSLRALQGEDVDTMAILTLPEGVTPSGVLPPNWTQTEDGGGWQWQGALNAAPTNATFPVQLTAAFAPGTTLVFTLTLSGALTPEPTVLSASTRVPSPILLIDDAGYDSTSDTLKAALDAANLPYDVWRTADQGTPSLDYLSLYPQVIWNLEHINAQTLTPPDRELLQKYYQTTNGKLLVIGVDTAYEHAEAGTNDSRATLENLFNTEYVAGGYLSAAGDFTLATAARTYTVSVTEDDAAYDSFPDVLQPVNNGVALLTYPDGRAAGVQGADGRVQFLALAFDRLTPDDAAALIGSLITPHP